MKTIRGKYYILQITNQKEQYETDQSNKLDGGLCGCSGGDGGAPRAGRPGDDGRQARQTGRKLHGNGSFR